MPLNSPAPIDPTEACVRQIAAVHRITQGLFARLSLDDRIRDALSISMQAVDASAGSIYLHRPADDALVFQYVVGPPHSSRLIGQAMPAGEGIAGEVFRTGRTVLSNDPGAAQRHRRDIGEAVGFVTINAVTVPLMKQGGDPVGVMQILNKTTGDFNDDDISVLEIVAAVSATAIENADLQREAQMAAVARAVGNLSHDIKNRIAPVAMVADMLESDLDEMVQALDTLGDGLSPDVRRELITAIQRVREEYPEYTEILRAQVRAVQEHTRLISDVLKGIQSEAQMQLCDLGELIAEQITELSPVARERGVTLERELVDMPPTRLDPFFIRSALYNLVNNAIPETPTGGRVTVRTRIETTDGGAASPEIVIEVEDTGSGMPPQILERLLRGEANSTKPGGSGLGTKIVFNAVRAHGGVLEGTSAEGKGTLLRMRLPMRTD